MKIKLWEDRWLGDSVLMVRYLISTSNEGILG